MKKRKCKTKVKRTNKCNTKCSKLFWFKGKSYQFFKDYSVLISESKYNAKYGEGLKTFKSNASFILLLKFLCG